MTGGPTTLTTPVSSTENVRFGLSYTPFWKMGMAMFAVAAPKGKVTFPTVGAKSVVGLHRPRQRLVADRQLRGQIAGTRDGKDRVHRAVGRRLDGGGVADGH